MQGKQVTVTAAVVIVDGTNGDTDKPVRAWIRPETGTVYLGGSNVDATHGLALKSTDQPLPVVIIGEHLWCFAASSIVVDVLYDGA